MRLFNADLRAYGEDIVAGHHIIAKYGHLCIRPQMCAENCIESVQDISEMIGSQFVVQQPDSNRKKNQAEAGT